MKSSHSGSPMILPYSATTVAEAIHALLDEAAAAHGRATLAIPGGRSPGPVLTALAKMLDPFVRDRLHLLWVDERGVPVGHPDRNDLVTLAAWQAGGPLPAQVHPMPAEQEDLEAAALAYTATLHAATGGRPLDVVLLGIGEDGHIASLFPNHDGLKELAETFAVYDSPKPPPRRLSFSLPVLKAARTRIILALGAAKAPIVRALENGPNPTVPVTLLAQPGTYCYADDAAASGNSYIPC